jgi:hypothetical protein
MPDRESEGAQVSAHFFIRGDGLATILFALLCILILIAVLKAGRPAK